MPPCADEHHRSCLEIRSAPGIPPRKIVQHILSNSPGSGAQVMREREGRRRATISARVVLFVITLAVILATASCITVRPKVPVFSFVSHAAHSNRVVVFISGFRGDLVETWRNPATGAYWPRLLAEDKDLSGFDVAVVAYPSEPFEQIARHVENQLLARGIFSRYGEIYFVAHSMGGLVLKRILIDLNAAEKSDAIRRVRLVAFLATPSQGSPAASWGAASYPELAPLTPNSDYLQLLDTLWGYFMRDRKRWSTDLPRAACAYETLLTAGFDVVSRVYANSYCDDFYPFAMDHSQAAKPESRKADPYVWVKRHILETHAERLGSSVALDLDSKASLSVIFRGVHFVKRAEGEYLAVINATLRNTGTSLARHISLQHQHRPGQWTGVVTWPQTFDLAPRADVGLEFGADTYAAPLLALRRGEHTYFALRADWEHENGLPGCRIFFFDYFGAPGSEVGQTVIMRAVHDTVPDNVKDRLSLPMCN